MDEFETRDHPKADRALIDALRQATDDEPLRAVVELEAHDEGAEPTTATIEPADYPDRTSYRQALIDHRREKMARRLAPALEAIKALGVHPLGQHGTSKTVVVEGPARSMVKMLDVRRVKAMSLDRKMTIDYGGPQVGESDSDG